MKSAIQNAVKRGVEFLLSRQQPDGKWEDFEGMPVGATDAWMTAYVASYLRSVQWAHDGILACVSNAADWLETNRADGGGWGFNKLTGADTDSTAIALKLLIDLGRPFRLSDANRLLDRIRRDGGFATYDGPGAWGVSHADVTPVALQALSIETQKSNIDKAIGYLDRIRRQDGTWPAYWWRTCHYVTFHCLKLRKDYGLNDTYPSYRWDLADRGVYSIFDVTFLCATASLLTHLSSQRQELTRALIASQRPDGGWAGGFNLRVTAPNCYAPWDDPRGKLYCDWRGYLTTASAISVLAKQL